MRTAANKPGLLTLTIKDKSALYLAYMPFVKNGGLFIPTNSNYRLGDEVFMLLNLMGEDEKLPVAGRVIWMTPKGAQGKRTAGIGVQFSEQDRGNTQRKIESYLAGALGGDKADAHDVGRLWRYSRPARRDVRRWSGRPSARTRRSRAPTGCRPPRSCAGRCRSTRRSARSRSSVLSFRRMKYSGMLSASSM